MTAYRRCDIVYLQKGMKAYHRKEKKQMENYLFYRNTSDLTAFEKKENVISFETLINYYAPNRVYIDSTTLSNIDESIWDNMSGNYYDEETDSYPEIFQMYLCHFDDYDAKALNHFGVITTYSDLLECDVICITHYGTHWGYVSTCAIPCDDFDRCYKPYID